MKKLKPKNLNFLYSVNKKFPHHIMCKQDRTGKQRKTQRRQSCIIKRPINSSSVSLLFVTDDPYPYSLAHIPLTDGKYKPTAQLFSRMYNVGKWICDDVPQQTRCQNLQPETESRRWERPGCKAPRATVPSVCLGRDQSCSPPREDGKVSQVPVWFISQDSFRFAKFATEYVGHKCPS